MTVPVIFNQRRRRLMRDRAAPGFRAHAFARNHMVEELLERLGMTTRRFTTALDLGCADGALGRALAGQGMAVTFADPGARFAQAVGGVQCDEDRLPFAGGRFDLVMSAGVLDSVNDLPGALTLIRQVLKTDGLFLGAFLGAGTLPVLRAATLAADMAAGGVAARLHPQIDVRAAGDLLARAGFVLPVADGEGLEVRYPDVFRLVADLRGMAAGNMLAERGPAYGKERAAALAAAFAESAGADGRVTERFEIVYLSGWAPQTSSQRKPGSA